MQPYGFPPLQKSAWIPVVLFFLGTIEVFHPHPHDLMSLDLNRWLAIHYSQLLLFPLAALAVSCLIRDRSGFAAGLCRVSMFVFAISYIAFDTAAGIVTGILVRAAHESGSPDSWIQAISAVWEHPIMGAASTAPALLAVLGSIALSIGTVGCAVTLKRSGSSSAPSMLLALAGSGISIFRTHAWPGGPLTFWGIGVAAAWILWEARNRSGSETGIPDH